MITVDIDSTLLQIAGVTGDAVHNELVEGVSLVKILREPA